MRVRAPPWANTCRINAAVPTPRADRPSCGPQHPATRQPASPAPVSKLPRAARESKKAVD